MFVVAFATFLASFVAYAAPTTTVTGVVFSADNGESSSDRITNTASQTITATLSAPLMPGEKLYYKRYGTSWADITASASGATVTHSASL